MNNWQKILIGIVVSLFVFTFAKDQLIKSTMISIGSSVVGAQLKIGHLSLGVFSHKVRIQGVRLYNPDGFPNDEALLDVPEINCDIDLTAFLKGEAHIPYIVIDVKQMTVIKNRDGKLNIDSLKVVEDLKKSKQNGDLKSDASNRPVKIALKIDYLRLSIGEVVIKDFQKSNPPAISAYTVGVNNKEFRDIKSVEQLVTLVMVQGLGPTGLKAAGLYAAASILGVTFLPVGIVSVLLGGDSAVADYDTKFEMVYEELVKIIQKNNGRFKVQERSQGIIKAVVQECDVAVKLATIRNKTKVTVSARKLLIPKPEVAGGIIHQLSEKIN